LVRSNLVDSDTNNEIFKQEKHNNSQNDLLDDIEKKHLDETSNARVSVGEENFATVSEGALGAIDDAIDQKIHDQDAAKNIVPGNSHKIKTKGFDDETDLEDSKEALSNLELVGEAEDTSTQVHSRDENTHFEKKIEELKAGFTSQFAEREEEFSNALQAIIGASNFIADELETQISEFVLSLASGLAGMRIDEIPAPFSKKIQKAAKQIAGNDDEVKVYLNSKDFEILTGLNFDDGLQYTFHGQDNLKRGEFEVLSSKSSARVSLFDLAVGD
jgi:flagellar biosynthesis/type III secretory pathway protein FliH